MTEKDRFESVVRFLENLKQYLLTVFSRNLPETKDLYLKQNRSKGYSVIYLLFEFLTFDVLFLIILPRELFRRSDTVLMNSLF